MQSQKMVDTIYEQKCMKSKEKSKMQKAFYEVFGLKSPLVAKNGSEFCRFFQKIDHFVKNIYPILK